MFLIVAAHRNVPATLHPIGPLQVVAVHHVAAALQYTYIILRAVAVTP